MTITVKNITKKIRGNIVADDVNMTMKAHVSYITNEQITNLK